MHDFNRQDPARNAFRLVGPLAGHGYDWWWHSFTACDPATGEEKPFFVEFFLCNPALGGSEPVLGQLRENRAAGRRPSYLMVKAGTWGRDAAQLHRFFGWGEVRVTRGAPYAIDAADCHADETSLRGQLRVTEAEAAAHPEWMCGAGEMSFDLRLDKRIAFNVGYGASTPFRGAEAFEMYWHAEGMKTLVSGTVTWNGRVWQVLPERSFGYADKNWGRGFTSPWVWLSSWDLTSRRTGKHLADSVFDIGGGRPKVYQVALERQLLSAFWYEGTPYEFNFSRLQDGTKTAFSAEETDTQIHWLVRQETHTAIMESDIVCDKADMLLVNYEAPDGEKRHNRLWNGGNGRGVVRLWRKTKDGPVLIDEMDAAHIGCEYGEYC